MCLRFSLRAVTLILFASTPFAQAANQPSNRQVLENLASLPLGFEQNVGEVNKSVDFVCHAAGYSISLSRGELLVVFNDQGSGKQGTETLRISLAGADKNVEPQGIDVLPGVTHYYIGNDPAQWKPMSGNSGRFVITMSIRAWI
jgi:ABC-type microcin C transport system duplicated ATPase subunit YejF